MLRTLQDELRATFVGRSIEDVKLDETTGRATAYLKLAATEGQGLEVAVVCVDATSVADGTSIWPNLA